MLQGILKKRARGIRLCWAILWVVAAATASWCGLVWAQDVGQRTYPSPDDGAKALINSVKAHDTSELLLIFGPDGQDLISSGDDQADKARRERFSDMAAQGMKLVREKDDWAVLNLGEEDWVFPIPLVKKGESWFFDTKAGKEEILTRRIGRNELNAMKVCTAYVQAQRDYAGQDQDGDEVLEYAQKIVSETGKKDGLYWALEGESESPFGPLLACAACEEVPSKSADLNPGPFKGYYYKILKAQGKNAPGGAYNYLINGNMIAGFALVAYPAEYGSTGIMTLMVNQQGEVYEKDLGKRTEAIAKAMKTYDPDSTWKKAE